MNNKPHHEAEEKPDTGAAAAAASYAGLMKAEFLKFEYMFLKDELSSIEEDTESETSSHCGS